MSPPSQKTICRLLGLACKSKELSLQIDIVQILILKHSIYFLDRWDSPILQWTTVKLFMGLFFHLLIFILFRRVLCVYTYNKKKTYAFTLFEYSESNCKWVDDEGVGQD